MNDTTRELGTTLGVAILGSLLSSAYTSHLPAQISQLPASARSAVEGSLGGAVFVGRQIGGSAGAQLTQSAKEAWVQGVHLAFGVGAAIVLVAAVISFLFLERRTSETLELTLDDELLLASNGLELAGDEG